MYTSNAVMLSAALIGVAVNSTVSPFVVVIACDRAMAGWAEAEEEEEGPPAVDRTHTEVAPNAKEGRERENRKNNAARRQERETNQIRDEGDIIGKYVFGLKVGGVFLMVSVGGEGN